MGQLGVGHVEEGGPFSQGVQECDPTLANSCDCVTHLLGFGASLVKPQFLESWDEVRISTFLLSSS